jgi:hypothetical protein
VVRGVPKDVEEEWVGRIRTIKYKGDLLLNGWEGKKSQDLQLAGVIE